MQLEDKAGVIIEATAEGGRELDAAHINTARGKQAGAALEQVERRVERELGVAHKRAQLGGRLAGTAADGEKALDQRARLLRQRGLRAERCLFEKAVGDLADRAAADGGNAGDRQQIGDQRMRGLRIGAGQRREHALIFRPGAGGADREAIEVVCQRGLAIEIFDQAPLPGWREIERGDQRRKQPDVAEADFRRGKPITSRCLQAEREHLRISRRDIRAPEGFNAGLQKFARLVRAVAGVPETLGVVRDIGEGSLWVW